MRMQRCCAFQFSATSKYKALRRDVRPRSAKIINSNYRIMRTLLSTLLALLCLTLAASAATWPASSEVRNAAPSAQSQTLDNSPFSEWQFVSSPAMDAPIMAMGQSRALSIGEAVRSIKSLSNSASDFEIVSDNTTPKKHYLHLRELRDGLPVLSGRIDLVYDRAGSLSRWNLREHSQWTTEDSHLMSRSSAASILASTVNYHSWSVNNEQSFAAWYPDHNSRTLRPVYWLRIEGTQPHERWEGVVDAVTGEIIIDWPGIQSETVSGTVSGMYWPEYMHEEPQVAPHAFQTVTINANQVTTNTLGEFSLEVGQTAGLVSRLRGPYVLVLNDDLPEDEQVYIDMNLQAPFDPVAFNWTNEIAVNPELNLYYHTMFVWMYYKILDEDFTGLDYPVPAVANLGHAYDNAYWNGYGTYYGEGAQYNNFAMYSDIIYHEYTHGVTDGIYPNGMLPYTGQSGSMNEAWSDYFACSINDDPVQADWIGGTADGFRDLESNMIYDGTDHEVHADSPYISAPLWTIRSALGAPQADNLAHFARYALAETYIDYLVAVLEHDDNDNDLTNGTPNYQLIYDAFGSHGIGPDDEPNFVIQNLVYVADGSGNSAGNGNRFIEQGEVIEMSFTVLNDVILYPPPATGVMVAVTTNDPDIEIENGAGSFGTVGPAQSFSVLNVLLNVDDNSPDRWTDVLITVTSNGGSVVYEETITFSVGTPRILIVQDDESSEVEDYVVQTAQVQNRIFDSIELADNSTLPDEYIPEYGLIVWLSGNADGAILTSEDQWKLNQFMEAGNKVVLSGQHLANGLIGTNFLQSTIQAEVLPEPTTTRQVTTAGGPFVRKAGFCWPEPAVRAIKLRWRY